jgi:hypothetical protein
MINMLCNVGFNTSSIWLKSLILDLKLIANLFRLAKQPVLQEEDVDPELLMLSDDKPESFDDAERNKDIRRGIDLATTLERIAKNFVITDPRLPDNPIVKFTNFPGNSFFLICNDKFADVIAPSQSAPWS